jgi:hypothetical protein
MEDGNKNMSKNGSEHRQTPAEAGGGFSSCLGYQCTRDVADRALWPVGDGDCSSILQSNPNT